MTQSQYLRQTIIVCVCCFLLACSTQQQQYKHTIFVFGTLVEITLFASTEQQAESAFLDIEKQFLLFHSQWTPWQSSDLSEVNRTIAAGKPFVIPESLKILIQRSKQYHQQSDGLFNPAIGKLIKLWQFHRIDDPELQPPAQPRIDDFLQSSPTIADIVDDGTFSRSENSQVDLNFGAFAKGIAVAWAIAYLQDKGIENAIVNTGGDLAVIGHNLTSSLPWSIGIRHPRKPEVIASVAANDGESVFTSGDYERYYEHDGKRMHHILNPRTGYPAYGTRSVTVIDKDAGKADAAATALFIAGKAHWHRIAKQMGIGYVMLIDDLGHIHMNPAMAERIRFKVTPDLPIVISEPL